MTLLLGGALRFSEYDYFQEQIVKFIVMNGSGAHAESDREFTDWKTLADFIDTFLEKPA
jgi:menaquinone-dependent protoporphyrinogen oxidase